MKWKSILCIVSICLCSMITPSRLKPPVTGRSGARYTVLHFYSYSSLLLDIIDSAPRQDHDPSEPVKKLKTSQSD
jgi:hypothetical protein